ncbi:MAG: DEAD/DEAH box helicase [Pseudomonadota bacterium]|uniref:DEAD/DEAH box helicase n=1 Tax=Thermithiobacillus tepidarius TaxID=929 RepID=UPI0004023CEE|nr:DEAD/DEAH box helicase [Thermithiobacillus tepidarius]
MSFQELQLAEPLLRAIEASGYTNPTEIQRQAIPVALEGRDLMASAQTGTGKTAAFVLPALQRLQSPAPVKGRGPRVLVLTPTRELATQVQDAIKRYARFTKLRVGAIVGGVPYPAQERLLAQPLDLLVATPGRLIDHMQRKRVDFSRLELLVLDEADRMLDMGFIEPVEQIAAATPANRQTLLFSATLEGSIARLAARMLRDPVRIQVAGVQEKHDNIEQRVHIADNVEHKRRLLEHLLDQADVTQAIIFTATKAAADNLAMDLADQGHATAALHGDMRQSARNRTVQRMRRGDVRVLVATDVAARGLDIQGISHVINFDLPMVAEDYVHRIGRTGRGGAFGVAVSLTGPQDWHHLTRIERFTGQKLARAVIPGLEPKRPEPRMGGRSDGGPRRPSGNNRPRHGEAARGQSERRHGGYAAHSQSERAARPQQRGDGAGPGKRREFGDARPARSEGGYRRRFG